MPCSTHWPLPLAVVGRGLRPAHLQDAVALRGVAALVDALLPLPLAVIGRLGLRVAGRAGLEHRLALRGAAAVLDARLVGVPAVVVAAVVAAVVALVAVVVAVVAVVVLVAPAVALVVVVIALVVLVVVLPLVGVAGGQHGAGDDRGEKHATAEQTRTCFA
jgi:ABC-type spermidine/putrescine transport system permease subunit II